MTTQKTRPRILSIDGGGLRGIFTVQILKELEQRAGKPIYELFDLIIGSSTGSIIAFAAGQLRMAAEQIEQLYFDVGRQVFTRSRLTGTWDLLTKTAYWNTQLFETHLQELFTSDKPLESLSDQTPLLGAVAAESSVVPGRICLFTSYPRTDMPFYGSTDTEVWRAIRASCAAPYYFQICTIENLNVVPAIQYAQCTLPPPEKAIQSRSFLDGSLIAGNPAQIALLEARAIFGEACRPMVLSVGTGEQIGVQTQDPNSLWLYRIGQTVVQTATSPQHITTFMAALLGKRFFRINGSVTNSEIDDYALMSEWRDEGKQAASEYQSWEPLIEMLRSREPSPDLPGEPSGDKNIGARLKQFFKSLWPRRDGS